MMEKRRMVRQEDHGTKLQLTSMIYVFIDPSNRALHGCINTRLLNRLLSRFVLFDRNSPTIPALATLYNILTRRSSTSRPILAVRRADTSNFFFSSLYYREPWREKKILCGCT